MIADSGQQQQQNRERRRGIDRRRSDPGPDVRRLLRVLAKLAGVLLGTLVGLVATNLLSAYFITPLKQLSVQAQEIVDEAQTELQEVDPLFNDARQEWMPLENRWVELGGGQKTSQQQGIHIDNDPAPDADESGSPVEESGTLADPANVSGDGNNSQQAEDARQALVNNSPREELDQLDRIRHNYMVLQHRRQLLNDQMVKWEAQLVEYQRNINLVNLLSIVVVLVFAFAGYLLYPLLEKLLVSSTGRWEQISSGLAQRTTQAVVGFFAGMVLALVVMLAAFSALSMDTGILAFGWFRLLFGAFVVIMLGVSGSLIGITYFSPGRPEYDPFSDYRMPAPPKLLDTSVIIDGRVHEVAASGFLGGALVVINSVLRELQTLADSHDERKRSKGRRGLELVRKMQEDPRLDVRVFDDDQLPQAAQNTDEQLMYVASEMRAQVATNDYNLNRVAAIRNIRVININELANAVKTNHIPGEFIDIAIVDKGKQQGQGVGYLPDGTMVVVEDGERYIGRTETIKLTSVTQTVAGRLIFGRVDLAREDNGNGN